MLIGIDFNYGDPSFAIKVTFHLVHFGMIGSKVRPNVCVILMEEIRRSPVEVASLSHYYLHVFFYIPRWLAGFLNHQLLRVYVVSIDPFQGR